MGDVEADGAAAVRDCRMAGEKRLRRIVATMMGNAIGLPATVLTLCDAAIDTKSLYINLSSKGPIAKSSNKASGMNEQSQVT